MANKNNFKKEEIKPPEKELFSKSEYKKRVEIFLSVKLAGKKNIQDIILLIRSCIYHRDYSSAIKIANKFIPVYPNKKLLEYFLTESYFLNGDQNDAKNSIKNLLQKRPQEKKYLVLAAKIYVKNGSWEKAENILNELRNKYGYLPGIQFVDFLFTSSSSVSNIKGMLVLLKYVSSNVKKIRLLRYLLNKSVRNLEKYVVLIFLCHFESSQSNERRIVSIEQGIVKFFLKTGKYEPEELSVLRNDLEEYLKIFSGNNLLRLRLLIDPMNINARSDLAESLYRHNTAHYQRLAASHQFFNGFSDADKKIESSQFDFSNVDIEKINFEDNDDSIRKIKKGSKKVVLIFTGINSNMPLSISIFHNTFKHINASFIYLRDSSGRAYANGIPTMGKSVKETSEKLSSIVKELKAEKIYCIGNSAGGYGAILFGTLIGANVIYSISGITTLNHLFNVHDNRGNKNALREVQSIISDEDLDLLNLLNKTDSLPDIVCYYGSLMSQDKWQAERLASINTVNLIPMEGATEHWLIIKLYQDGTLHKILNEIDRD